MKFVEVGSSFPFGRMFSIIQGQVNGSGEENLGLLTHGWIVYIRILNEKLKKNSEYICNFWLTFEMEKAFPSDEEAYFVLIS